MQLGHRGFRASEDALRNAPTPVLDFASQFLKSSAFKADAGIAEAIALAVKEKFSVKRVHFLGRGLYGAAGIVEGWGREVLKLTSDPSDVEASMRISGEDLPNVAQIHAAGFLAGTTIINRPDRAKTEVGLIVQEAVDWVGLDEVSQDDALHHEVYRVKIDNFVFNRGVGYHPEERRARMMKASLELRSRLLERGRPFDQVGLGLWGLQNRDIYLVDVHAGNVGWSELDQAFKIFDLGFSVIVGE